MSYIPQIRILVPSAQVDSYTSQNFALPSSPSYFDDTRAVFGGSSGDLRMDFINVSSGGTASSFGNHGVTFPGGGGGNAGSNTRGITVGALNAVAAGVSTSEFLTFATGGGTTFFGSITVARGQSASSSNQTRVVCAGGFSSGSYYATIDYATIATTGSFISFGSLTGSQRLDTQTASPIRAVVFGGFNGSNILSTIQYMNLASTGNAISFGNLTEIKSQAASTNTATTAFCIGGDSSGTIRTRIESLNLITTGNAVNIGSLASGVNAGMGTSSQVKAILAGGFNSASTAISNIETMIFTSAGSFTNFGTLSYARGNVYGGSASHGGLQIDYSSRIGVSEVQEQGVAVIAGGYNGSSRSAVIDYVNISTLSDAASFGSLVAARDSMAGFGSNTRGVWAGGDSRTGGYNEYANLIDYVTIATTGNATNFGALTVGRRYPGGGSNQTRGVIGGGDNASGGTAIMDYVTIASTGNAISFGNLLTTNAYPATTASSVYVWFMGGGDGVGYLNGIQSVVISTTGNSSSWGTILAGTNQSSAACDSIRAFMFGGFTGSALSTVQYMNVTSAGNTVSWGSLSATRTIPGTTASRTTAVIAGGQRAGTLTSNIEAITTASLGAVYSFGSLTQGRIQNQGTSSSHGGL